MKRLNLNDFATADKAETGVKIELLHPISKVPMGSFLTVREWPLNDEHRYGLVQLDRIFSRYLALII